MIIFASQNSIVMKRKIIESLLAWKNRPNHKPLILNGARQVGKTYILEEFGKQYYKNYIRISLDLVPNVRGFLSKTIEPLEIIAYIESMYDIRILPHETLVILDEIQDCKRALLALKYFREDHPEYDIAAAGSLLGIAINKGEKKDENSDEEPFSYPVGKVDELSLYPMDFEEFLWAIDHHILAETIKEHYLNDTPMSESVHAMALDLYQKYLIIGGMPESVSKYVETHSYLESRMVQQSILTGYNTDMGKYAKPSTTVKIRACYDSIPAQLAKENRKFQYKLAQKGGTAAVFGEAIEWLLQAGITLRCKLISHGFIPISTQEDDSDFKIYMHDVGLLNIKADIPVQMLLSSIESDNTFLGSVAENYVGQALTANGVALRYWKNGNTGEVDFVIQNGMEVIPVEVKKGRKVKAISMNDFKKKYDCSIGYRISSKNFGFANGIKSIPLYAVFCIGNM